MAAKGKPVSRAKAKTTTIFECKVKPDARDVYLVGDFNDWNPRADRMGRRGDTFQKAKRLEPGDYLYKFLVDGEWHTDPSAIVQVPNEFGTMNSLIRVRESLHD